MLFICHTELSGFDYYYCTNAANENCDEFCVKEVFKCRERRMMQLDEGWTKAQAWGCPRGHPKKYPRGTSVKAWGCPRHPHFINKSTRSFFNALYFYCFMHYVLLLERLYFLLCVWFFNKVGPHHSFVLERDTLHLFSSLFFLLIIFESCFK